MRLVCRRGVWPAPAGPSPSPAGGRRRRCGGRGGSRGRRRVLWGRSDSNARAGAGLAGGFASRAGGTGDGRVCADCRGVWGRIGRRGPAGVPLAGTGAGTGFTCQLGNGGAAPGPGVRKAGWGSPVTTPPSAPAGSTRFRPAVRAMSDEALAVATEGAVAGSTSAGLAPASGPFRLEFSSDRKELSALSSSSSVALTPVRSRWPYPSAGSGSLLLPEALTTSLDCQGCGDPSPTDLQR